MKQVNYRSLVSRGDHEAKANRYTVKCQINSFLILTAVWVLNVLGIFIIDSKLMNVAYFACAGITVVCYLVGRLGGAEKSWGKYVLIFLAVLFSTTLGTLLTYQAVLVAVIPICYSMQYNKKEMVYYTYLLTIISIVVSTMGGFYFGLCDANMLTLTKGPVSDYVDTLTNTTVFDTINTNPWGTLPLYYALPRCMILFAVIIIVRHAAEVSAKRAVREMELKKLGETDGMTGLYNKNKYLSMMEKYYPSVPAVGVIFFDADGLKTLNDTYGHEVGDSMIIALADSIHTLCDENVCGYRIGGDEFVVILERADEQAVCQTIEKWRETLGKINRQTNMEFSASVGYAVGAGERIEEVIRRADEQMYVEKNKKHQNRR